MRTYQNEADTWRIRAFLREVFLLNGRRELAWQAARWDYWRGFIVECLDPRPFAEMVYLWENEQGQIVAVLNPDNRGDAFLQLHPSVHATALLPEMLAVAEQHLSTLNEKVQCSLRVWSHASTYQDFLSNRGYHKLPSSEYQFQRNLENPVEVLEAPAGYQVRSLGGMEELPSRSWASWRAFHPDEPDEDYKGWEWYLSIQRLPMYRRDLDIVAMAPGGGGAGFTTIWYDDVTRTACCEPVGVMPEYQGIGLGKAIMTEGLYRAQQMGATLATVGGYSLAARALYGSVFGRESVSFDCWEKTW